MKVIAIAHNNWAHVSFQMTFRNWYITLVILSQFQHGRGSPFLSSWIRAGIRAGILISQSCQRLKHSCNNPFSRLFHPKVCQRTAVSFYESDCNCCYCPNNWAHVLCSCPRHVESKKVFFKALIVFCLGFGLLFTGEVSVKRTYGVIIL